MNSKQLKVDDIKQELIDKGYYTSEEVQNMNLKGKKAWSDLYDSCTKSYEFDDEESILGNTTPEEPEENNKEKTPQYDSPEWHDYVMAQFTEKELIQDKNNKDKQYPSVGGLRRVTGLLLGNIVESGPIDLRTTMDENKIGKSVIVYEVGIEWQLDSKQDGYVSFMEGTDPYPLRRFKAVASSTINNTDDDYAIFPEAIAETRAEGRALRRALGLNVVCADELTKKNGVRLVQEQQDSTDGEWESDSLITDQQINTITVLCDRLGIDIDKFINSGSRKYNSIDKISKQSAAGMLKQLNRYQSSGEDSVDIPQELKKEKVNES